MLSTATIDSTGTITIILCPQTRLESDLMPTTPQICDKILSVSYAYEKHNTYGLRNMLSVYVKQPYRTRHEKAIAKRMENEARNLSVKPVPGRKDGELL